MEEGSYAVEIGAPGKRVRRIKGFANEIDANEYALKLVREASAKLLGDVEAGTLH